ncbi:NAD(P)/FAD-dependent oxidoreductase [Chloroflexota bacterium]
MADYDAVVIGGGPAGLTAGLYLSRAKWRTILLEKENFGGSPQNVDWIENYPGYAEGISGPRLSSEMVTQATKYGLQLEEAEVTGIELFSSSRWVACADGKGYTTGVVIIAGGCRPRKLGVPGEELLEGRGVFTCALCDGGQFDGGVVAVCGGGDAAVIEALYMTKIASKVILLVEAEHRLRATAILLDRAKDNPKLEIRREIKIEDITGSDRVEAIELLDMKSGQKETLKVDGVLVHIGMESNTNYLDGIVPLDSQGQIVTNDRMETEVPYLLACGDIRNGSPRQIATAVGDGATAAISAIRILQEEHEAIDNNG